MINWLAQKGHDCAVITTYPYYPYWKVQGPYAKYRFWYKTEVKRFDSGGNLTVFRCPMYVPENPSGIKRMILDLSFFTSAFCKLIGLLINKKFDFVFVVAPSFQVGLLGVLYKKIRGTKLIYHIQDMQIEAARDLQMIKSKKLISALFKLEGYILKRSDVISSISEGMINKLQEKVHKEITLFPNWADISLFYPIKNRAEIKVEFGFNAADKIALYSGAIGEKQGLEAIIWAADAHREYDELKFVICGSGPYKEKLQDLAVSLSLRNVVFFPLQPSEKFNRFLNIADVHLVIQKANASDLVMPSKLTTILAVGGLALITAPESSSLYKLVHKYSMGLLVEAESQQALNEGITKAISESNYYIGKNARVYAENYLSIDKVMGAFEQTLIT